MKISKEGKLNILMNENAVPFIYLDSDGNKTIGVGHLVSKGKGYVIKKEESQFDL